MNRVKFSRSLWHQRYTRSRGLGKPSLHDFIPLVHGWVVDIDLKYFFGGVNRYILMARLARHVEEK
jgi:hypothetical protein